MIEAYENMLYLNKKTHLLLIDIFEIYTFKVSISVCVVVLVCVTYNWFTQLLPTSIYNPHLSWYLHMCRWLMNTHQWQVLD